MRSDDLNVALATLYLRLSGYLTTGLILHAPRKGGQNKGEIDCLAVRLPFHDQAARGVDRPAFLGIEDNRTDVIICEVKSKHPLFNRSLQDPANLADALRWVGAFPPDRLAPVVKDLISLLKEGADKDAVRKGVVEGNVCIRPLLCAPQLSGGDAKSWCLTWTELFRFLDVCLDPAKAPVSCSRRYSYDLWGSQYVGIVEWFKKKKRAEDLTWDALFNHLNPHPERTVGMGS